MMDQGQLAVGTIVMMNQRPVSCRYNSDDGSRPVSCMYNSDDESTAI